uniref:Transmembrane protein 45a n=1 Tax=Cyprinodon variegatus TaxID=28743 RepID=A0A3Q2FY29_CYPVA
MGSFKGHALPGSFFLLAGIWWTGKFSLWYATRKNKSLGSARLASRASQRRVEVIESSLILFFSFVGMVGEQFVANGPKLHLYNFADKHWEQLHIWQHTTMYLFFGLAAIVSLIIHTTEAAPVALDRLMLAIAFFNEGVELTELAALGGKGSNMVPLPLPPPWSSHAGRPCASAAPLRCLWRGSCCVPGGLPQREHHSGAAALHPHTPAGELVLGDWLRAVPSQRLQVGHGRPQHHDVYYHVLFLAPRLCHASCRCAVLYCQLCGSLQAEEDTSNGNGTSEAQGAGRGVRG